MKGIQPFTIPEIAIRIGKLQDFYVDSTHLLSNQRFQLSRSICHSPLARIELQHQDTMIITAGYFGEDCANVP